MIARVGREPARVVEVRDWCHVVHHFSPALAASGLDEDRRAEEYRRLRTFLKAGRNRIVIEELGALAAGRPTGSGARQRRMWMSGGRGFGLSSP